MVRPDLPPPANAVGSFETFLDKARRAKRVGTLFGEKNGEGNTFVDLPVWFTRTGLRTFEIDSGFGLVKCCAPDYKAQQQMEAADEAVTKAMGLPEGAHREAEVKKATETQAAQRIAYVIRVLREIPAGWKNEGDEYVRGSLKFPADGPLHQPTVVASSGDVEAMRAYAAMLPPSLIPQVFAAVNLMALPPLAFDELRATDPS
jgi:hypothetical protein